MCVREFLRGTPAAPGIDAVSAFRQKGRMDPSHIMQVGMGFWASKTLLSAVELELFTVLAKEPLTASQIAKSLALSPRAVPDFPDALVALHLLSRAGDGPEARYSNTPE